MFSNTILVGRLGSDPELKRTQKGDFICSFSVATTGKWLSKNGQEEEKVTWHKVVCWNKLAELCSSYLAKGRLVLVDGEIVKNSWEDKDGNKQESCEIRAKRVLFLDSKDK